MTEKLSIAELAREHMMQRYFGGCKASGKKAFKMVKSNCCMCGRSMESPDWERGPKYCYKCADKHEVGHPDIN